MIRVRRIAVMALVLGCEASSPPSGSSDTGTSTSVSTTSTSTSADASSSESGPPPGDGILQCVEMCEVPSECCIPGLPCPGPYPNNVDCQDGLCVEPKCVDDAECDEAAAGTVCRVVRGNPSCVIPCTDDAPCTAAALGACVGTDDVGGSFCFIRCDAPGEFCGNETCDAASGLCTCTSDGNCQSDWLCLD
jgi:hypothetical protein